MARPTIRKAIRRRPTAKRASLPAAVASAVVAQLTTAVGSGRVARTAPARTKRKTGALSHPAARGKAGTRRPTLAAAVASAVTGRLSASGAARKTPARKAKPRGSLVAAVASAVSRQLAGRAALRRR